MNEETTDNSSLKQTSHRQKNRRGCYLSCWASPELFAQVCEDAARAGLSRSDYMKEVLGGAPVPRKYRVPNATKLQVAKFTGQVGKIGSNLNQLAKQVNIAAKLGKWESLPTAAALAALILETQAMLAEIQATIQAVNKKPTVETTDANATRVNDHSQMVKDALEDTVA